MLKQLTECDRLMEGRWYLEGLQVSIHICIKVNFSLLDEAHNRNCGKGFRNRRSPPNRSIQVDGTISLGEDWLLFVRENDSRGTHSFAGDQRAEIVVCQFGEIDGASGPILPSRPTRVGC